MPNAAMQGLMAQQYKTKDDMRKDPDYPASMTQLALEQLKTEMPDVASKVKVKPMGPVSRLLGGSDTTAQTYPWNTITYNPEHIQQLTPQEIADVMAHELTHVRQFEKKGFPWRYIPDLSKLTTPYMQQPREQEAFAASDKRRANRRDIQLPAE